MCAKKTYQIKINPTKASLLLLIKTDDKFYKHKNIIFTYIEIYHVGKVKVFSNIDI